MDIDLKDPIESASSAAEARRHSDKKRRARFSAPAAVPAFDAASAIALLAVTALTRLWPLYRAALIPTSLGVLMGLAGLMSLPLHPDALIRLLS